MRANSIIGIMEDGGVPIPGLPPGSDSTSQETSHAVLLSVGRQLGRCFTTGDTVRIDNITIERRAEHDSALGKTTKEYLFTTTARPDQPSGGPASAPEKVPEPVQPDQPLKPTPTEQQAMVQQFMDRIIAERKQNSEVT